MKLQCSCLALGRQRALFELLLLSSLPLVWSRHLVVHQQANLPGDAVTQAEEFLVDYADKRYKPLAARLKVANLEFNTAFKTQLRKVEADDIAAYSNRLKELEQTRIKETARVKKEYAENATLDGAETQQTAEDWATVQVAHAISAAGHQPLMGLQSDLAAVDSLRQQTLPLTKAAASLAMSSASLAAVAKDAEKNMTEERIGDALKYAEKQKAELKAWQDRTLKDEVLSNEADNVAKDANTLAFGTLTKARAADAVAKQAFLVAKGNKQALDELEARANEASNPSAGG